MTSTAEQRKLLQRFQRQIKGHYCNDFNGRVTDTRRCHTLCQYRTSRSTRVGAYARSVLDSAWLLHGEIKRIPRTDYTDKTHSWYKVYWQGGLLRLISAYLTLRVRVWGVRAAGEHSLCQYRTSRSTRVGTYARAVPDIA
eukprot:3324503-Rhodomonas_salina.2